MAWRINEPRSGRTCNVIFARSHYGVAQEELFASRACECPSGDAEVPPGSGTGMHGAAEDCLWHAAAVCRVNAPLQ